jgi:hypothetical protein
VRLTAVEEGMAGINRRVDRVETRLDRIEKRRELVDTIDRSSESFSLASVFTLTNPSYARRARSNFATSCRSAMKPST